MKMKKSDLSKKVRDIRSRKGMSQEVLAENSGLSLRTIQRIENGETEPRGDTLKRLSNALEVNPDEIMDWAFREDDNYLAAMNLSALSFLLFPLLGIIIPLIMWISKKDRIKKINRVAKEILNFQITWNIFYFLPFIWIFLNMFTSINIGRGLLESFTNPWLLNVMFFVLLYLINFTFILINAVKSYKHKEVNYFLGIRFIR